MYLRIKVKAVAEPPELFEPKVNKLLALGWKLDVPTFRATMMPRGGGGYVTVHHCMMARQVQVDEHGWEQDAFAPGPDGRSVNMLGVKDQLGRILDYVARFHDVRAAATGCEESVNECGCDMAQDWRSFSSRHWTIVAKVLGPEVPGGSVEDEQ